MGEGRKLVPKHLDHERICQAKLVQTWKSGKGWVKAGSCQGCGLKCHCMALPSDDADCSLMYKLQELTLMPHLVPHIIQSAHSWSGNSTLQCQLSKS
eukprot:1151098-Pelagomonas_calceolata.AAC.7